MNNNNYLRNIIDKILSRAQPVFPVNQLPLEVRNKLIEIRSFCYNLGFVNAMTKTIFESLDDGGGANNLIADSIMPTNGMSRYLNDIIELHKLIKEYIEKQHPDNVAQNIIT